MTKLPIILADLDVLLDTRLAILSMVLPEDQFKRETADWGKRPYDGTASIPPDMFLKLWRARDASVLPHAIRTMVPWFLMRQMTEIKKKTPLDEESELYVAINIYPYELSSEQQEAMRLAIYRVLGELMDVKIVRHSHTELPPSTLLQNYITWYKYDLWEWLKDNYDAGTFEKDQAPGFQVFVPAICTTLPTAPIGDADPWDVQQAGLSGIVQVTFTDQAIYSAIGK